MNGKKEFFKTLSPQVFFNQIFQLEEKKLNIDEKKNLSKMKYSKLLYKFPDIYRSYKRSKVQQPIILSFKKSFKKNASYIKQIKKFWLVDEIPNTADNILIDILSKKKSDLDVIWLYGEHACGKTEIAKVVFHKLRGQSHYSYFITCNQSEGNLIREYHHVVEDMVGYSILRNLEEITNQEWIHFLNQLLIDQIKKISKENLQDYSLIFCIDGITSYTMVEPYLNFFSTNVKKNLKILFIITTTEYHKRENFLTYQVKYSNPVDIFNEVCKNAEEVTKTCKNLAEIISTPLLAKLIGLAVNEDYVGISEIENSNYFFALLEGIKKKLPYLENLFKLILLNHNDEIPEELVDIFIKDPFQKEHLSQLSCNLLNIKVCKQGKLFFGLAEIFPQKFMINVNFLRKMIMAILGYASQTIPITAEADPSIDILETSSDFLEKRNKFFLFWQTWLQILENFLPINFKAERLLLIGQKICLNFLIRKNFFFLSGTVFLVVECRKLQSLLLINIILTLRIKGHYTQALDFCDKALKVSSPSQRIEVLLIKLQIYIDLNSQKEARLIFTDLKSEANNLSLQQNNKLDYLFLLLDRKDIPSAEKIFNKLYLRLDSDNKNIYSRSLFYARGLVEIEKFKLKKLVNRNEKQTYLFNAINFLMDSLLFFTNETFEKSMMEKNKLFKNIVLSKDFSRQKKLYPEFFYSLFLYLGMNYQELSQIEKDGKYKAKQVKKALFFFNQSLSIVRKNFDEVSLQGSRVFHYLNILYYLEGKFRLAIKAGEKAIQTIEPYQQIVEKTNLLKEREMVEPYLRKLHFYLGITYGAAWDIESAENCLRKVEALNVFSLDKEINIHLELFNLKQIFLKDELEEFEKLLTNSKLNNHSYLDLMHQALAYNALSIFDYLYNKFSTPNIDIIKKSGEGSRKGFTFLHKAVFHNNKRFVKYLLAQCTADDISYQDNDEYTPLHVAAYMGYVEVTSLLVKNDLIKKNFETADKKKYLPFDYAVDCGNDEIAMLLKPQNKFPQLIEENSTFQEWWSQVKKINGRVDEEKFIREFKKITKKEAVNFYLEGVLYLPATFFSEQIVKLLLHRYSLNTILEIKSAEGENILHLATRTNYVEFVEVILKKFDSLSLLNEISNLGQRPLDIAATLGRTVILTLFIDKLQGNIEKGKIKTFGWSALHRAAIKGEVAICKQLISRSECLGIEDFTLLENDTWISLHEAVISNSPHRNEIVRVLLEKNPHSVNFQEENGDTPLHLAMRKGHLDTVHLLLTYQANLNVSNNDGMTPFTYWKHHKELYSTGCVENYLKQSENFNMHVEWKGIFVQDLYQECWNYFSGEDKFSKEVLDRHAYYIPIRYDFFDEKLGLPLTSVEIETAIFSFLTKYQGCFLSGSTGSGKSMLLERVALKAWNLGYIPLIITCQNQHLFFYKTDTTELMPKIINAEVIQKWRNKYKIGNLKVIFLLDFLVEVLPDIDSNNKFVLTNNNDIFIEQNSCDWIWMKNFKKLSLRDFNQREIDLYLSCRFETDIQEYFWRKDLLLLDENLRKSLGNPFLLKLFSNTMLKKDKGDICINRLSLYENLSSSEDNLLKNHASYKAYEQSLKLREISSSDLFSVNKFLKIPLYEEKEILTFIIDKWVLKEKNELLSFLDNLIQLAINKDSEIAGSNALTFFKFLKIPLTSHFNFSGLSASKSILEESIFYNIDLSKIKLPAIVPSKVLVKLLNISNQPSETPFQKRIFEIESYRKKEGLISRKFIFHNNFLYYIDFKHNLVRYSLLDPKEKPKKLIFLLGKIYCLNIFPETGPFLWILADNNIIRIKIKDVQGKRKTFQEQIQTYTLPEPALFITGYENYSEYCICISHTGKVTLYLLKSSSLVPVDFSAMQQPNYGKEKPKHKRMLSLKERLPILEFFEQKQVTAICEQKFPDKLTKVIYMAISKKNSHRLKRIKIIHDCIEEDILFLNSPILAITLTYLDQKEIIVFYCLNSNLYAYDIQEKNYISHYSLFDVSINALQPMREHPGWVLAYGRSPYIIIWDFKNNTLSYLTRTGNEEIFGIKFFNFFSISQENSNKSSIITEKLGKKSDALLTICSDGIQCYPYADQISSFPPLGHQSWIYAILAYKRNSEFAISGGKDGTINLWNIDSKRYIRQIACHKAAVHCLTSSSDTRYLVSADAAGTVKIFSFENDFHLIVSLTPTKESIRKIDFLKKQDTEYLILTTEKGKFFISDLNTILTESKVNWDIETISKSKAIYAMTYFKNNSNFVFLAGSEKYIYVYDIEKKKKLKLKFNQSECEVFKESIYCLVSLNESELLVSDKVGNIFKIEILFSQVNYQENFMPATSPQTIVQKNTENPQPIYAFILTPDKKNIIFPFEAEVCIRALPLSVKPHRTVSAILGKDQGINLYGHKNEIYNMCWTSGRQLVTAGADNNIILWDILDDTHQSYPIWLSQPTYSIFFSENREEKKFKEIIINSQSGYIILYENSKLINIASYLDGHKDNLIYQSYYDHPDIWKEKFYIFENFQEAQKELITRISHHYGVHSKNLSIISSILLEKQAYILYVNYNKEFIHFLIENKLFHRGILASKDFKKVLNQKDLKYFKLSKNLNFNFICLEKLLKQNIHILSFQSKIEVNELVKEYFYNFKNEEILSLHIAKFIIQKDKRFKSIADSYKAYKAYKENNFNNIGKTFLYNNFKSQARLLLSGTRFFVRGQMNFIGEGGGYWWQRSKNRELFSFTINLEECQMLLKKSKNFFMLRNSLNFLQKFCNTPHLKELIFAAFSINDFSRIENFSSHLPLIKKINDRKNLDALKKILYEDAIDKEKKIVSFCCFCKDLREQVHGKLLEIDDEISEREIELLLICAEAYIKTGNALRALLIFYFCKIFLEEEKLNLDKRIIFRFDIKLKIGFSFALRRMGHAYLTREFLFLSKEKREELLRLDKELFMDWLDAFISSWIYFSNKEIDKKDMSIMQDVNKMLALLPYLKHKNLEKYCYFLSHIANFYKLIANSYEKFAELLKLSEEKIDKKALEKLYREISNYIFFCLGHCELSVSTYKNAALVCCAHTFLIDGKFEKGFEILKELLSCYQHTTSGDDKIKIDYYFLEAFFLNFLYKFKESINDTNQKNSEQLFETFFSFIELFRNKFHTHERLDFLDLPSIRSLLNFFYEEKNKKEEIIYDPLKLFTFAKIFIERIIGHDHPTYKKFLEFYEIMWAQKNDLDSAVQPLGLK